MIRAERRFFAVVGAIGIAPTLVVFTVDGDDRALIVIDSLVQLYLQLLVTFRTLYAVGAMPAGYERHHATQGRFLAVLLGSILFAMGVAAASTLLIVPGVLLLTLWSVWMPAMAAERLRPPAALARSWRLVRPDLSGVFVLVVAVATLWLIVITVSLVPAMADRDPDLRFADLVGDAMLAVVQLFSAALWAVVYAGLVSGALEISGRKALSRSSAARAGEG